MQMQIKLRTRLHLALTAITAAFVIVLLVAEFQGTRARVREDIEAANQVAAQLLGPLVNIYSRTGGTAVVLDFLDQLGHVRSNDIMLRSPAGNVLYRSPPAAYKAGRYAPAWFARLLAPSVPRHLFPLPSGLELIVAAEPSRAILDGWDACARLLAVAAVLLIGVNALALWTVARAVAPFPIITDGLTRIQRGELGFRLPALPGFEARVIGDAFNRMAQAVEDKVAAERRSREAQMRLEERRELALLIEQRLEEERRLIAHELHDELGQSVTAIRSLAQAIVAQSGEPLIKDAARLISTEAARLYDAMHGLIPRLAPVSLETLSLAEALESLVDDLKSRHPGVKLSLRHELPTELGPSVTLAAYRVAQEGLINALRHAHASCIEVDAQGDSRGLRVAVSDDGSGLTPGWSGPGHFGLRGLTERVEHLGGRLTVGNREPRGVRLTAEVPLSGPPPESA